MGIFGVIPFIKLQNTLKQQLNGEKPSKWDGELRHLSVFDWAMLFDWAMSSVFKAS